MGESSSRSSAVIDNNFEIGEMVWTWLATTVLVESLLDRRADDDLGQVGAAIERLAAAPTDVGFLLRDLTLLRLRGLLARAHADDLAYQQFMSDFRAKAAAAGFDPPALAATGPFHGTSVEYSHASHSGRSGSSE